MNTNKHLENFKTEIASMNWYSVPKAESIETKAQVLTEFINKYANHELSAKMTNDQVLNRNPYHEYEIYAKEGYGRVDLSISINGGDLNEYEMYVLNRIYPVLHGKSHLEDYKGGTRASYTVWAAEPSATKVEMVKQFIAKHEGRFVYVQHTKLGDIVTNQYLPLHPNDIIDYYEVNAVGGGQLRQVLRINLLREPLLNYEEQEALESVIKPIKDAMPADVMSAIRNA